MHIKTALTHEEWTEGLAVMHRVYVGEGYTPLERAQQVMSRTTLEGEGRLLTASTREGRAVGALLYLKEDSSFRQVARPGEREFRFLAVDANSRRSGAARALVVACLAIARSEGAQAVVLWTRTEMRAAQYLYESLGFVRCPERDEDDARGFRRLVYRHSFQRS